MSEFFNLVADRESFGGDGKRTRPDFKSQFFEPFEAVVISRMKMKNGIYKHKTRSCIELEA